jgi:hypothetical protein
MDNTGLVTMVNLACLDDIRIVDSQFGKNDKSDILTLP